MTLDYTRSRGLGVEWVGHAHLLVWERILHSSFFFFFFGKWEFSLVGKLRENSIIIWLVDKKKRLIPCSNLFIKLWMNLKAFFYSIYSSDCIGCDPILHFHRPRVMTLESLFFTLSAITGMVGNPKTGGVLAYEFSCGEGGLEMFF